MPGRSSANLLLAAVVVLMLLLVATEAGRLITIVRAVGASVGAVIVVAYAVRLPTRHDLVDRLVLAGLLVFLLACVISARAGQSFDAATTALAYAGAFYLARDVVQDSRGRNLAVAVLASVGLVVVAMFLVQWSAIWLEWLSVPAAGMPPLELFLPSAPYGHYYRVAMLVGLLAPGILVFGWRGRLRPLAAIGGVASAVLIVMSGSRTAWLAGVVAVLCGLVAAQPGWLAHRKRVVLIGAAVVVAGGVVVVATPLVSRLATTSTVELRLAIWESGLARWLESPLVGHGPGTFPAELLLSGYYNRYEQFIPHAHNALIQTLVESGLLGLIAMGFVAAALIVGIGRAPRMQWAPVAAIAFFVAASLTETPIQHGYMVLPLIIWAALAAPRLEADEPARASPAIRFATGSALLAIGVGVVVSLAGSAAYDRARSSAETGTQDQVVAELRTAVALDPASALYRRDLGIWLLAAGRVDLSRASLEMAVAMNPADQAAYRALAILALELGDRSAALGAARTAADRAQLHAENHLARSYVAAAAGEASEARSALIAAVRREPWLLAAPVWATAFPNIDEREILDAAERSWEDDPQRTLRNARARTWLAAMTGRTPPDGVTAALLAEDAFLRCDLGAATGRASALRTSESVDHEALQTRVMLARMTGYGRLTELRTLIRLRDRELERQAFEGIGGSPAISNTAQDIRVYGRLPVPTPVGPVLPTAASGLSAWLRDPEAAADLGAPGSGLAECR